MTERTTVDPELLARVQGISLRIRGLVSGALQGAYRSSVRGTGIEFEEVRPYLPGDDVRSIDWKVTARTGEPHIKTYVEERQLTLLILLDTSRSMDFGSSAHSKREKAAEVAALLALVAGANQDQVGLCLFADEPGFTLPPDNKPHQVQRIVREILAARATGTGSGLATVLDHADQHLQRRGLVVVISDFLGIDVGSCKRPFGNLARKHDVISVRMTDPFEEELPRAGRLLFEDLESGQILDVDTRSKSVRADWSERARERRQVVEEITRKVGSDLIEVSTTDDVGERILGLFARRARRGGVR